MAINTIDDLVSAMGNASSRLVFDKTSIGNTAAGQFTSMWRATGQPGQGAIPTAAATCNQSLIGCFTFPQPVDPVKSYIAYLEALCATSTATIELHDRLMHMGGLSGTVTTAQTVGIDLASVSGTDNMAARVGETDYSSVQWWLEWYADTGATACNATVAVTYNDGSTGNLTAASLAVSRRASLMFPLNSLIPAAKSGLYIRGVSSVTLSASTGTVGNFGITATRPRCALFMPVLNSKYSADWAGLPFSTIEASACPFLIHLGASTATGLLRGNAKIVNG